MQKKIIALAIAGLASTAAFAQTNVTVYGVMDIFAVRGTADNATTGKQTLSGINAGGLSGSRIGFRGTEDLGNGLKALFTYELGTLDPTQNTNGITGTRQAFLGLTGNFGTFVAGRLQNPGYNFAAKYDTLGAAVFSPVGQLSDNAGLSISARDTLGRLDNAAAYVSPSFSGLTIVGAYAFGEQIKNNGSALQTLSATNSTAVTAGAAAARGNDTNPQSVWALAAEYDNGPLSVGVVYHKLNDIFGTDSGDRSLDRKEWAVGGAYDFKVVKLSAMYQRADHDNGATADVEDRLWQVGAAVPVGDRTVVKAAYGRLKSDTQGAVANGKATSWGLDVEYSLSKRTTAYAGYSRISNNKNYAAEHAMTGSTGQTATVTNGKNSSIIGVGLRHTF